MAQQQSGKDWRPSGISIRQHVTLSQQERSRILALLPRRKYISPDQKDGFVGAIELAISLYRGAVIFFKSTTPKKVRAALSVVERRATTLLQAAAGLDPYSSYLLAQRGCLLESQPGVFQPGSFVAVKRLRDEARMALSATQDYPHGQLLDLPRLRLAVEVATAMRDCLRLPPTSKHGNPYRAVLETVLHIAAGCELQQDVRRLVRNALNDLKALDRPEHAQP